VVGFGTLYGAPVIRDANGLSPEETKRRWRRLAILSTAIDIVFVPVMFALVPTAAASVGAVVMIGGTADIWYLDRRLQRTGQLFRTKEGPPDR
jgi:hypothetical protein